MLLRCIFVLVLFMVTSSAFADDKNYNCLRRLETDDPLGDSITVYTLDHRIYRAERPIVNFESSILYFKLRSNEGVWDDVTVPFDNLNEVTYCKHGAARGSMILFGFGVGAIVGGLIGVALAPEPEGWLDMPEFQTGMIGAFVGGIVGAVGGNMIGSRMTVRVKLKCW